MSIGDQCKQDPSRLISDSRSCAMYYNCSNNSGGLSPLLPVQLQVRMYYWFILSKCIHVHEPKARNKYQGGVSFFFNSTLFLFCLFFVCFLAFDICRFCVVIRFFHPRHNGQWPPTSKDFYPFHFYFLRKSQYFPFSMLSDKQGHYWYHFYNVFGMTRSLTGDWTRDLPHSMPALYH